jgi:hypothetical protein
MQCRDLLRLLRHQVHLQDIRKQVVIAIPVTPVVQRDQKEVAAL